MSEDARYLTLKSTDIYSSNNPNDYYNKTIENSSGIVTQNRRSITWKNVNMRKIMGDEYYDKYSQFTIRCVSRGVGMTTTGQISSTILEGEQMRRVVFYLSGLSFNPSTPQVMIEFGSLNKLPNTGSGGLQSPSVVNYGESENMTYTFFKPSNNVNLKIDMLNYIDEQFYQPTASTSLYGHSVYTFEIIGVL